MAASDAAAPLAIGAPAIEGAPPAARDLQAPQEEHAWGRPRRRLRYPFTRRTPLLIRTGYDPRSLARSWTILDRRPLYWTAALIVLAVAPQFGSNSLLSSAVVFAMYAAINIVWMLVVGTAGIWSLATLAI